MVVHVDLDVALDQGNQGRRIQGIQLSGTLTIDIDVAVPRLFRARLSVTLAGPGAP
jgi:hypothetical protein